MWPDDLRLRRQALDLYGAVWLHVPPGIRQAAAWGGDWFAVSTPFLVRDRERVLAHAGMISCTWACHGRALRVAALHGVCVHPEHRGRGLARRVLEEALAHVDAMGFETVVLWSEKVDLYRRFGFEPVPESLFSFRLSDALPPMQARLLDLNDAGDLELLRGLLANRQPVCEGLAAADDGWHFWIDLGLWTAAADISLVYLPAKDVAMVCELAAGALRIHDVIGPAMPSINVLVCGASTALGVDAPPPRSELYFTPDRLDVAVSVGDVSIEPHSWEDVLMVRGTPLPGTEGPFALSPLTRT